MHAHFDALLVGLYNATFADRPAVLAAILQGRPFEKSMPLHLEGPHLMSSSSLAHLFDRVYVRLGWRPSLADRMVFLVHTKGSRGRLARSRFDHIQEGFGLLMAEAGIEAKEWSGAFRTPYWNHAELVDWTGYTAQHGMLPMDRVLFAPAQWLFVRKIRRCCGHTWPSCRSRKTTCAVRNWRRNATDCCSQDKVDWNQIRRRAPYAATLDSLVASHELVLGGTQPLTEDWLRNSAAHLLRAPPLGTLGTASASPAAAAVFSSATAAAPNAVATASPPPSRREGTHQGSLHSSGDEQLRGVPAAKRSSIVRLGDDGSQSTKRRGVWWRHHRDAYERKLAECIHNVS